MFTPDRPLTEVLNESAFTLSAEVIPPRNGTEQSQILTQIQTLVTEGAQFLAVTKGAGGSLRGGSLPIAHAIKDRFQRPSIAHFTCRDLLPIEVENQLMDHHYFGIRNVLALRGDPPDGQTHLEVREGAYRYAYELIRQIRRMNEGEFIPRVGSPAGLPQAVAQGNPARERTQFCIGAAAYPEHPHPQERIDFFAMKVREGATFGITDMLYDVDAYSRFLDGLGKVGVQIPILPGTRVLKSQSQALKMMKKFRVQIPTNLFNRLPADETPDSPRIGTELFLELTESLKRAGAPGIHVFVIVDTAIAAGALRALNRPKELSPLR